MMDIIETLSEISQKGASDIFIVAGRPLSCKINGRLETINTERLMPVDTEGMISQIYKLANRDMHTVRETGDDDFAFAIPGISRYRASTFKQRGSLAAVVRVIQFALPDPKDLGIPDSIMNVSEQNKGLVLVTGPAGSGKSTTLACMIDQINSTMDKHIITLEEPVEYLHSHKKSIVTQREICLDTESYVVALRAALRQSPDVILLGEMRDYETIQVAMTAAETGHLVISTLHTIGAANTIDRIIDVFPANQQRQIATQLSMTLQAVISQSLVPTTDNTLTAAFELMTVNPAIRNMIRENKIHQIDGLLYSSVSDDMFSIDSSLLKLYKQQRISEHTALTFADNPAMLKKKL